MPVDGTIRAVSSYWDELVTAWLAGGPSVPEALRPWARGYRGAGRGVVDTEAMPELWHGPLDPHQARVVFLALNPGEAHPEFQHRTGRFAHEIRDDFTGYTDWAASWPYLREPWESMKGRNRHHSKRLNFARRWFNDPALPAAAMVSFEMYPWHSTALTGALKPDPEIVRLFVLGPVAELAAPVFAFGAPWIPLLEQRLGLPVIDRLGAGGRDYGSAIPSRSVTLFDAGNGTVIVASKHNGPAGPPSASETELLRRAAGNWYGVGAVAGQERDQGPSKSFPAL
jgi:hypothetical protein